MQWEYSFERIDTQGHYLIDDRGIPDWEDINALGAAGWELVSVFGAEGSEATAVFKRQIPTEVKPR